MPKKALEFSISHKLKCKNPHENIVKQNPTAHKKSINIIYDINKLKKKNISIHEETHFIN